MQAIVINMGFMDDEGKEYILFGSIERKLLATDDVDNEENCVRLGEQLIREGFARLRAKSPYTISVDNKLAVFPDKDSSQRILNGKFS